MGQDQALCRRREREPIMLPIPLPVCSTYVCQRRTQQTEFVVRTAVPLHNYIHINDSKSSPVVVMFELGFCACLSYLFTCLRLSACAKHVCFTRYMIVLQCFPPVVFFPFPRCGCGSFSIACHIVTFSVLLLRVVVWVSPTDAVLSFA